MALKQQTIRWLGQNCRGTFCGKTVLITGANSGVGFKSAELMVFLGAKVVMACRNREKADAARAELLRDYPGAQIDVMPLDLADLSSVASFAERLKADRIDIDVFVNNAGVFRKPGQTTKDGFELVLGTNYVGSYYLTECVLPYLASLPHGVLLIHTISIIHKIGTIDYDDFFCGKRYRDLAVYARSKLCLAKYSYDLARKYENTGVRIRMSHPGISITPLGANAFGSVVKRLSGKFGWLFNSPEKSALALPYLMANDLPAGSIVGPRGFLNGWGYPAKNRRSRKAETGGAELAAFTRKLIVSAGIEPPPANV